MIRRVFRVALVGAGQMGSIHARVIRDSPEADLVVIVEQNRDLRNSNSDVPFVDSIGAALSYDLDCAIVAVPTEYHEQIAIQLAEAGIPTLIEKPLSYSSDSANRIVEAFSRNKVSGFVGHVERFNPAVLELMRRLESGELGRVFQIATRRQSTYPNRVKDIGVSSDLGTHDIDLTMMISKSKYLNGSAFMSSISGRKFEDLMVASAKMENGILVNHLVNWLTPFKDRSIVVTGEAGVLLADTTVGDLTLFKNAQFELEWDAIRAFRGVSEGEVIRFSIQKTEPIKSQLNAFLASVQNNGAGCATLQDGAEAVRVVELLKFSAENFVPANF
jgi:predicted dehydrogenase